MNAIYLEWVDSASELGWMEAGKIAPSPLIRTVAWLVRETDDSFVISHSCDMQDPCDWADPMTIPKAAVKTRRELDVFAG